MAADFVHPDFTEPLDTEPLLRACTPEHRIKGLFFDSARTSARRLGLAAPMARYTTFKDYPTADYVRVVAGWVTEPGLKQSSRELIRRIGQGTYESFRATIAGKVLLAAAGDELANLLRASERAYAISIVPGTLTSQVTHRRAVLELRNIPTFADAFHVGVFEGVLEAYGVEGSVRVRRHSPVNVDLLIEWN